MVAEDINDPLVVRQDYKTEDRFLARRLSTWAELDGPLVEDVALDVLRQDQPRRVLDVGCGTGDITQRVRDAIDGHLAAVDLSERMVALTQRRGIAALVTDIEHLPFADGRFDAVLANRVLYHLPHLAVGLREIARVLRPEGRLVAVTYSERHLEELTKIWGRRRIESTFSAESGVAVVGRHFDRVHSQEVTGTAVFRTTEALEGFSTHQFGAGPTPVPAALSLMPLPFQATYRHCVIVGTLG